jgi:hypothetical protein
MRPTIPSLPPSAALAMPQTNLGSYLFLGSPNDALFGIVLVLNSSLSGVSAYETDLAD